ncbi:MAG TPA: hypothetical protein HA276_04885 [Candidatus Poseidoniaceae archaeon]|nr:MAG: hypothetical protein CBD01_003340 [Euryarchaeota archaeon TMED141]DAC11097.1 MAG TPA: hypothetical protein D7I09_01625 [Candidatus Poseidoniales archaeon]DAC16931.1 MAG TPA: hypothetical protein D7I01_04805 [Candidatus Poseidoniales archaeon]HII18036.1 hypothetical protein [Candidatus Poseidoniaceae archaeon]HII97009.1 hypothetical protein [Candidatus Poseidoniaceae archaeon]|tara:strand:- start:271 stop:534 length:264 start_codon:yes stop_codon:yes gene_type:complete
MEQNGWDVVWEEGSSSEWIVEYVVEHGSDRSRHLSFLVADDADGVREALIEEIREAYPEAGHLEITVVRLEMVEDIGDLVHEGDAIP